MTEKRNINVGTPGHCDHDKAVGLSGVERVVILRCPCCDREWTENCEQAICIELHSECCVCRFTSENCGSSIGTADELLHIYSERQRREQKAI